MPPAALEGRRDRWGAFLDRLVFVDNLSRAAGIEDEAGTELARALEHLMDRARGASLAVLIDHHHKKGHDAIENKSRGSTSIAGATDINVEMVRDGHRGSRRRKLSAQGRLRVSNWERIVELSDDGREYRAADKDGANEIGADAQRAFMDRVALGELGGRATVADFMLRIGVKSRNTARCVTASSPTTPSRHPRDLAARTTATRAIRHETEPRLAASAPTAPPPQAKHLTCRGTEATPCCAGPVGRDLAAVLGTQSRDQPDDGRGSSRASACRALAASSASSWRPNGGSASSPGAIYCTSALGASRVTGSSPAPGKLRVGVLLPTRWTLRMFLITYLGGRVLTAPFTLKVS